MRGRRVLAEQWTIFMNGREKSLKTLNFSARTTPSSAFGTFSPRKKTAGGEGLSIKGIANGSRRPSEIRVNANTPTPNINILLFRELAARMQECQK